VDDVTGIQAVANLVQDFGVWAIFAYLYITEKRSHQQTTQQHKDDLREVAGMRHRLQNVQDIVTEYKPQTPHG
jgi:hypothetical protein